MSIGKLSATAKNLDLLFKILQKVIVVGMVAAFCVLSVLTVANAVNPDVVIGTDLNVLDLGAVSIELAEAYAPSNSSILAYSWAYAVLAAVCAVLLCKGLGYIRRILAPMMEGCPFHSDTAAYFKKLAVLSLIAGVVQNAASFIDSFVALRSFGLDSLISSGAIRSFTINYTFDLTFVVVFFLLLLMSYIFSYGSELQQLSDETL